MDNLSAGTRFLLGSKGRTYQPIAQRRFTASKLIPDIPDTDSERGPKTGCLRLGIAVYFASELLSGFVRIRCLLSIGIGVWNGPEYAVVEVQEPSTPAPADHSPQAGFSRE